MSDDNRDQIQLFPSRSQIWQRWSVPFKLKHSNVSINVPFKLILFGFNRLDQTLGNSHVLINASLKLIMFGFN